MPTPIDHLMAMLDQLTPSQLGALPPARRRQLSGALYAAHVLAEMAAGGKPFPPVVRAAPTNRCNPPKEEPKAGVLCDLSRCERGE
jgi:hypothetical protein